MKNEAKRRDTIPLGKKPVEIFPQFLYRIDLYRCLVLYFCIVVPNIFRTYVHSQLFQK